LDKKALSPGPGGLGYQYIFDYTPYVASLMGSTQQSYLIVGAGVFGASTALYLRQSDPSAIVTLLDQTSFPNPSAASHDLNKIIRADYDDIFYMKAGSGSSAALEE